MTEIKHVSLDAWNTLLIPNKEYARQRTTILSNIFTCSPEFAKAVYTNVKKKFDRAAEERGVGYGVEFIYDDLVRSFPGGNIDPAELRGLYFEPSFKDFQPQILEETITEIRRLKKKGITFSISSNTNFISGLILGPMIKKSIPVIDFMLFSDLMCSGESSSWAKPSANFFAEVCQHVYVLHGEPIDKQAILHIGDNRVCDFQGAASAGLQAQLITDAFDLPDVLKEL